MNNSGNNGVYAVCKNGLDFTAKSSMIVRTGMSVLFLLIEQGLRTTVYAQPAKCIIDLVKEKKVRIPISIGHQQQPDITSARLATYTGVFVPCLFDIDTNKGVRANVINFTLKILRDGRPISSAVSYNSLFTAEMKEAISHVTDKDVVRISNVIIRVLNTTSCTDCNLTVDSLEYTVSRSTQQQFLDADWQLMDVIKNTQEWKNLDERYASDAVIGRSVYFEKYQDKNVVWLQYKFYDNAFLAYLWKFEFNRKTRKLSIWDDIQKRHLTINQWKKLVRKIH